MFPSFLSAQVGRPVIDRTGLKGTYRIALRWETDAGEARSFGEDQTPRGTAAPSIFTALREQLGLRLRPGTDALRVLLIDRVARATDN
jgi:uncharacterized protein (TIGR03435 family)